MNTIEETYSLCALNKIFGFEPKIGHSLVSLLGSASEVFRLSEKETNQLIGPYSKYKGAINRRALDSAAEELDRISSGNISFIGYTAEEYPQLLLECEDAPLGLYVRSCTPVRQIFPQERRVAVVGTRDISPYGQE